jgi:Fe-S cluster assembly ATP-binding protein
MLEVKNLHVTVDGKQILKGLDLTVNKGEVHAIMGPNGSGKSTLAYVMAGKPGYEATEGQILLDGEDVLAMQPDERAAKGLFLAFQYQKRNETLQMTLLEPKIAVLDETDSGLDIDALNVVADGVNRLRSPERAFIVITHYQRLLDYIVPDIVHVLSKGRIVRTGGKELANELESTGYAQYREEAA